MTLELSGAQLIGAITLILAVGPTIFSTGVLWQRVRNHDKALERLTTIDDNLAKGLRALGNKIEEHSYKNCPVLLAPKEGNE